MKERILSNFYIALEAVLANKIRSILTALGIIFGVAAVIAMLAIGNGAQQEILEQIKLVGVNNVVITPIVEQKEEEAKDISDTQKKAPFSPGLTLADAQAIQAHLPHIKHISAEIVIETQIVKNGIRRTAKLVGVEPTYFQLFNYDLDKGNVFNATQVEKGQMVCLIGSDVQTRFFSTEEPIGKYIKCGQHWLKIIGVIKKRNFTSTSTDNLGIRNTNMDIYIPLKTMLMRYKNRSLVTASMIRAADAQRNNNNRNTEKAPENYHQLDRIVIQVEETEHLSAIAEIVQRMLLRRHNKVVDYQINIPELLLKQQQRTKDIFNIVLGAIAGISLVVGGIGIMNIMLASVLERIKEIGLRISLGAKRSDIVTQFLFEAVMISLTGGISGVSLGVSLAWIISSFANIPTIISFGSIALSFGVAALVGLVFGIAPARKAANQDPITSLRYE